MKLFVLCVLLCFLAAPLVRAQDDSASPSFEQNIEEEKPFVVRLTEGLTVENLVRLSQLYVYETIAIYGILLFAIFYQTGKKQNVIILNEWYDACRGVFEAHFAHVGIGKAGDKSLFFQESPAAFKFYASGRETIQFAQVSLELKKRQDIISNWFLSLVWPEKDRVTIDLPLFDQKEPICAAILRSKDLKTARENFNDLKGLCQRVETSFFEEDGLVLLAGDSYIANQLFDDATLKLLNANEKLVSLVHITDQKIFSQATSHVRVILNIPSEKKDYEKLATLLAALLKVADKLYSVKLTSQSRADALKEREILNEINTKDQREKQVEEAAKEKEKKLREERDRIAKLGKEELKKYEDKQAQKERKRLLQKRTMKVM